MGQKLYYEPNKTDAEVEINQLLTAAAKEAHEIVVENRAFLEAIAQRLLTDDTLTRDQVQVLRSELELETPRELVTRN